MANAFNLTAQINLQGPANLKQVASRIKKDLSGITSNVNVKINPSAEKSIAAATAKLRAMSDILSKTSKDARSLNTSLSSLNSSLGSTKSISSSVNKSLEQTVTNTRNLAKNTKEATSAFYALGKSAAFSFKQFAGTAILGGTIYKLTAAVKTSFKNFVDFDKQMVRVQQVTNSTASAVQGLVQAIDKASTKFGVSSAALAEVSVTLSQAGWSATQVATAMQALAKTEVAPTFESLQKTTEGVIAATNQFKLKAEELEAALGSINAVAARFAVESGDIIAAIQRAGGVFASASAGVSTGTEALNEFIAVFTSIRATTRESAETIATGLRTIFTRIQRGGTIAALKELGVELQNANGQFVGAYKAVERLSEGLNKLDPRSVQFTGIVEELGGFRQIGKILPLIQNFKVAQEALLVANKGQKSLDEAAAKSKLALAVQIAKVREEFDSLIRSVSGGGVFKGLISGVLSLTSNLVKLAKVFSPILPLLGLLGAVKVAKGAGDFFKGFGGALKAGGGAKGAGEGIGGAITGNSANDREKSAAISAASQATSQNTTALQSLTASVKSLEAQIKISNAVKTSAQKTNTGGSSSSILGSDGKPFKFARGGVVPGSGSGDTVPAMLTPGEFVVRKDAVKALGTEKLHKMNKYSSGGSVEDARKLYGEDAVGAAILKPESSNRFISSDEIVSASKADKQEKERLSKIVAGKTYNFTARGLKENYSDFIDTAIQKNTANLIDNLSKGFTEKYGNTPIEAAEINPAQIENFMTSVNDGLKGSIYEAFITNIERAGQYATASSAEDRNAPFDLTNGIQKGKDLYQDGLDGINFIDLKATLEAASVPSLAKKIGNTLLKDPTLGTGPSTGASQPTSLVSSVLESFKNSKLTSKARKLPFYADRMTQGDSNTRAFLQKAYEEAKAKGLVQDAADFDKQLREKFRVMPSSQTTPYEGWSAQAGPTTQEAENYAKGGYAKDTVPAMLTPGEFVINKEAASKIGSAQLNRMNKADKVQGFNQGGSVGFVQRFAAGGGVDPLGEQFMRSVEAMEAFTQRANEAGMHVYTYQMKLADEIVKVTNRIQKTQESDKRLLRGRASVVGQKISSDPSNVSQLQEARKEFIDLLSQIAPEAGKEIQQAATDIAAGLQKGLSFDTIQENSKALTKIMSEQITQTDALNKAIQEVADSAGLASENLQDLVGEDKIKNQQFIQSREGQAFGRFGKMAPGLAQSIAGTKSGQRLIGAAETFSGKGLEDKLGSIFGKLGGAAGKFGSQLGGIINSLGGPAMVASAALTMLGNALPGIMDSLFGAGTSDTETGSAIAGGVAGAGQGLGMGAVAGFALGGPVGAMIGGIAGAVIGGIQGVFKGIQTAQLNKNLKDLATSAEEVERKFNELEFEGFSEENLQDAFGAVAQQGAAVSQLGKLGQVGVDNILSRVMNAVGLGRSEEANAAFPAEMAKYMESLDQLGNTVLQQVSTDEISGLIERAEGASTQDEKNRIYADASQAKEAYVAISAGANATEAEKQRAEEDFFLEKAIATLPKELQEKARAQADDDPEARAKLVKSGREIEASSVKIQMARLNEARAANALRAAMENQVDIYRRVEAYVRKFNETLGQMGKQYDVRTNALQGRGELSLTDRKDEQVLDNMSAYSMDEVRATADRTAQLAGGGEQATKMSNQIMGAKIIQDELPKILANAGDGSARDIIDELQKTFDLSGVELDENLKRQLTEQLESRLETGRQGASKEELASDPTLLANLAKINEAALKAGIAIQKAYNDAIDKTISITNEMNKAYVDQMENLAKASKTRADAESQLANALGQNRTLEEMNAGSDAYARERFGNLTNNGELDPAQLLNIIQSKTGGEGTGGLEDARLAVEKAKADIAAAGADVSQDQKDALFAAEDAYAAMNQEVNDARSALEYLANDSTRAANALQKIQEQERVKTAAMDLGRKAMTATGPELGELRSSVNAFNRVIDGSATGKEVASLEFRQDAYAGFDNIKGLLGPMAGQVEADLQYKMLQKTEGGQDLLNTAIPGLDGKTYGEVLEDRRSGKTPESEYIEAYQQAVERQAQASESLAEAANLLRETFDQERRDVLDTTVAEIPSIVETAAEDTQVEADPNAPPAPLEEYKLDWPEEQANTFLEKLGDTFEGVDLTQGGRNSAADASNLTTLGAGIAGIGVSAAASFAAYAFGPAILKSAGTMLGNTFAKVLPASVTSWLPGIAARLGLTGATTAATTAATTTATATTVAAGGGGAVAAGGGGAAAAGGAGAAGAATAVATTLAALYGIYASIDGITTVYELITDWEGKTEELMQRELGQVNEGYWTQVFDNLANPGDAVASFWRGTNEWLDVASGGLLGWDTEFRAQKERVEAAIAKSQQQLEENMKLKGASSSTMTEEGAALTKDIFKGGELNLDQQKKVKELGNREDQIKRLEDEIAAGRGEEKTQTKYSYNADGTVDRKYEIESTLTKQEQLDEMKARQEKEKAGLYSQFKTDEERNAATNALDRIGQAKELERGMYTNAELGNYNPDPVDTPLAETAYNQMTRLADAGLQQGSIFTHDIHVVGELVTIKGVLESINESLANRNSNNLQKVAEENKVTIPGMAEFVTGFSASVEAFGTYVQQLSQINIPTIPSEINMNGNHVVDVRISGAAAFDSLEGKFRKLIKKEIGIKMEKIWNQTKGLAGEPAALNGSEDLE